MDGSTTEGPPPADGFGRDGVTWRPSLEHDPVRVAALYLQHRLLTAARHAWRHLHPDVDLTGSALADMLDTSTRPAEKRLAGTQPLQLDDIARLAFYLGDDILNAFPDHAIDLIPEPYRSLLGRWEPGHGALPTFRQDNLDWTHVIARLTASLDAEADSGRDHLLTTGGVTHTLVCALTDSGTDPSTIELDDPQPTDDAVCALVIGPHTNTTLISVVYLPDRAGQPRALADRLGGILHDTASQNTTHRVLVLVAGPAATRQLRTHLPDVLDSYPNTQVTLRFPTLTRTRSPGGVPSDLDITILAREQHHPNSTVLALLIKRR